MAGGGDRVGSCFPVRKDLKQGAHWIVEDVAIEMARSGSDSR